MGERGKTLPWEIPVCSFLLSEVWREPTFFVSWINEEWKGGGKWVSMISFKEDHLRLPQCTTSRGKTCPGSQPWHQTINKRGQIPGACENSWSNPQVPNTNTNTNTNANTRIIAIIIIIIYKNLEVLINKVFGRMSKCILLSSCDEQVFSKIQIYIA